MTDTRIDTSNPRLPCCSDHAGHGHVGCTWPNGTTVAKTCMFDCAACPEHKSVIQVITTLRQFHQWRKVFIKTPEGNLYDVGDIKRDHSNGSVIINLGAWVEHS